MALKKRLTFDILTGQFKEVLIDDNPVKTSYNPVKKRHIMDSYITGETKVNHYYKDNEVLRIVEVKSKIKVIQNTVISSMLGLHLGLMPNEILVNYKFKNPIPIENIVYNDDFKIPCREVIKPMDDRNGISGKIISNNANRIFQTYSVRLGKDKITDNTKEKYTGIDNSIDNSLLRVFNL